MIKILISMRVMENSSYQERRDVISHDWILFLENRGICPILVPNALSDPMSFLTSLGQLDGVILSNGNDSGVDNSIDSAPDRDNLENFLIKFAEQNGLPLLGVCRGLHVLNLFYGGQIVPYLSKSKGEMHVNKNHLVRLLKDQVDLPRKLGETCMVNSYHNHGVTLDTLATDLLPFASTENGVVEGVKHGNYPFWGIQWHPERDNPSKEIDEWLFTIFEQK